jgi:hypothetical protein
LSEQATISSPQQTTAAAANTVIPAQEPLQQKCNKVALQGPFIQPKLSIGAVDDPLEQEADVMADAVMRMPETSFIQRKCSHCDEEEKVQTKPLASSVTPFIQTKGGDGGTASDVVTKQLNATRGSGSNMDRPTQSFMESRFDTDFSNVKIHTGSDAVQMNREMNAQAFTVGNDIYFNSGKYNPSSESGKHLLAHELTHTVQQGGASRQISMARLAIGTANLNIDYGDIIFQDTVAGRQALIEQRYLAWTGLQAIEIHDLITPLTNREKRWLFYAIDVLADNSSFSAADRHQTFMRLINHLPTLIFASPFEGEGFDFEYEVLLASGWLESLPQSAFAGRLASIARLMQIRHVNALAQQQFTEGMLARVQQREISEFMNRARRDAAASSMTNIIAFHALPHIQRAVRIELSGENITLHANFELSYEGTTEAEGRTKSEADISRIRQAILDAWTVRFTTGPFMNMSFTLNPRITFRHTAAARNVNAWQIMVRQPDRGPSATQYWLGEISLASVHLLDGRIRAVPHEVFHLFGPFDNYTSPVDGYTGRQMVSVGLIDPTGRNRPDPMGMTDPVVLARWQAAGYITAEEVQRQSHITPAIWEEQAQQILEALNVQPPRRTADEREIEAEIGRENSGGYQIEQQEARLRTIREATRRTEDSMRWLELAEEAMRIETELGIRH